MVLYYITLEKNNCMKEICICGNLGANATRRTSSDGKELMTFSVAVNDTKGDTLWFNVVSNMRKSFEFLVKGQCVCVIGDLQVSLYNNKIDLSVFADRIELCGRAQSSPAPGDAQAKEEPSADVY